MAIQFDPALLVSAPILQDYLVDKDTGEALSGGLVYFYTDSTKATFKNVYSQVGTTAPYTYVAINNHPMVLTAIGTMADSSGNDIIPYYYPYQEFTTVPGSNQQTYYIEVYDSNNVLQFTRSNFPFTSISGGGGGGITSNVTINNLIANNVFYRNIVGTNNLSGLNLTSVTSTTIAPSQHDGFVSSGTITAGSQALGPVGPDIIFNKSIIGNTDTIYFNTFNAANVLIGDITPEYYLNIQCTNVTVTETYKYIQFPINLHTKTLSLANAVFTIQAQNAGSSLQNISMQVLQYTGTGAVSPNAISPIITFTTSSGWNKFISQPIALPDASSLSLGSGGDDALYLLIFLPVGTLYNINLCLPSCYLASQNQTIPTTDFKTYDQIDSIINTPRTGDVRTSINSFAPYGWVLSNSSSSRGSIGSLSSSATRNATDTWPLYSFLWNNVGVTYCPMVDGNPYGISAYIDFTANRALYLVNTVGSTLASISSTRILGSNTGTESYMLLPGQIPNHAHDSPSAGAFAILQGGTSFQTYSSSGWGTSTVTGTIHDYPGQSNISVLQPTTYMNMFIKL